MDKNNKQKKKINKEQAKTKNGYFMDNYNLTSGVSQKLMKGEGLEDGVAALDSGVMLTKSEIIDFSEGTDS